MKILGIAVGLVVMMIGAGNSALAADAQDIMRSTNEIKRVDDQIATLTFRFIAPDKTEKQVIYTMVWKNMSGENGYDSKAIFFTESPLDRKGIAYLGWLRGAGSDKLDDEWLYLPELRMTRRIVPHDHDHAHSDDEFGRSLLNRNNLEPRSPQLDEHRLIDEQLYNEAPHYRISSTPRDNPAMQHQGDDPAVAKRIYWIDKNTQRISRIQFFDHDDRQRLDMKFDWAEVGGYWLWRRIEAVDPATQEQTILEVSNIRINNKLKDQAFGKRNLEKGSRRFN